MSKGHEAPSATSALKISQQIEAGTRHAASGLGGVVTATLAYFGGEAVIRTIGIMSQASEAGLFSAESGSVVLGTIKTGAYVYSAVQAARWSWNMHSVAEQIESGTRSVKRKH